MGRSDGRALLISDSLASRAIDHLAQLVAIPSVSAPIAREGALAEAAACTATMLEAAGCSDVSTVDHGAPGPAVIARSPGRPGSPRVVLYAHYDVVDEGDPSAWRTDPFELTAAGDALFARGVADDKAAIAIHMAALSTCEDDALDITVVVEAEEERGSPHFGDLIARYHELAAADVFVVADGGLADPGVPAVLVSMRGILDCEIEVRTLEASVHSGLYGGAVPDAMSALIRILASLVDADGNVAVAGLRDDTGAGPPLSPLAEERVRRDVGMLPGTGLIGRGPLADRAGRAPAISVTGLDAPAVDAATHALAARAKAMVSVRLAPSDDPHEALARVTEHVHAHAPWGAEVAITPRQLARPADFGVDHPAFEILGRTLHEVWGVAPEVVAAGGNNAAASELSRACPAAALLITGAADSQCAAHAPNERVLVSDLRRAMEAEARLLRRFAARAS